MSEDPQTEAVGSYSREGTRRATFEVPPRQSTAASSEDWREHFAHTGLQSTESRVLHEEGENLLKVLKAACPGETRETWTYSDLTDMVQKAQQSWQSKSRLGRGKPQRLFHKLMQKFNAHSGLCSVIPSGDKYVSLVTGAVTILVQASVKHSQTIEQLSDGLNEISDAMGLCEIEVRLIRSEAMQNAISKLYISVFLFFGDAMIWYQSKSLSKVLKSLANDFSEKFRGSINKIKQLAASVQHIAKLGSEAEIRVIRLGVEDIRKELEDDRVGLQGDLRRIASVIHWQHLENLQQHQQTQALIAENKLLLTPNYLQMIQAAYDQPRLLADSGSSERSASVPQAYALDVSHDSEVDSVVTTPSSSGYIDGRSVKRSIEALWLARNLDKFVPLRPTHAPATNLHDSQLSHCINRWLSSPKISIQCIEWFGSSSMNTLSEAAAQILQVCQSSNTAAIAHYEDPLHRAQRNVDIDDPGSTVIDLMLNIAYQITQLQPHNAVQPSSTWECLTREGDDSTALSLQDAATIYKTSLESCPLDNLIIVIDGSLSFWEASEEAINHFSSITRDVIATLQSGRSFKMIIFSRFRLPVLVGLLDPRDIASIHVPPGGRRPKAPIRKIDILED